jgi:hypothetical protein
MSVILSPVIFLFGMILFSGKPKDMRQKEEADKKKKGEGRQSE